MKTVDCFEGGEEERNSSEGKKEQSQVNTARSDNQLLIEPQTDQINHSNSSHSHASNNNSAIMRLVYQYNQMHLQQEDNEKDDDAQQSYTSDSAFNQFQPNAAAAVSYLPHLYLDNVLTPTSINSQQVYPIGCFEDSINMDQVESEPITVLGQTDETTKKLIKKHFLNLKPHKIAESQLYLSNNLLVQPHLPSKNGALQLTTFTSEQYNLEGFLLIKETTSPPIKTPKFNCIIHEGSELNAHQTSDLKTCANCEVKSKRIQKYTCDYSSSCFYSLCESCLSISSKYNNGVAILSKNQNHSKVQKYVSCGQQKYQDYQRTQINIQQEVHYDNDSHVKEQSRVFELTLQVKDLNTSKTFICVFEQDDLLVKREWTNIGSAIAAIDQQNTKLFYFTQESSSGQSVYLNELEFNQIRDILDNLQQPKEIPSTKENVEETIIKSWITLERIDFQINKDQLVICQTEMETCLKDALLVQSENAQIPIIFKQLILINCLPVTQLPYDYVYNEEDQWVKESYDESLFDCWVFDRSNHCEPVIKFQRTGSILQIVQTKQNHFDFISVLRIGPDQYTDYILQRDTFGLKEQCEAEKTLTYGRKIITVKQDYQLISSKEISEKNGWRYYYDLYQLCSQFFITHYSPPKEDQIYLQTENSWRSDNNHQITIIDDQFEITVNEQVQIISPGVQLSEFKQEGTTCEATLEYVQNNDKKQINIYFYLPQNNKLKIDLSCFKFYGWNLSKGVNENSNLIILSKTKEGTSFQTIDGNDCLIWTFKVYSEEQKSGGFSLEHDKPIDQISFPLLASSTYFSNKITFVNLLQNQACKQVQLDEYKLIRFVQLGCVNETCIYAIAENKNYQSQTSITKLKNQNKLKKHEGQPKLKGCNNCRFDRQVDWFCKVKKEKLWFCDTCYQNEPIDDQTCLLCFYWSDPYTIDSTPQIILEQDHALFERQQINKATQIFVFRENRDGNHRLRQLFLYHKEQNKLVTRDFYTQSEKEYSKVVQVQIGEKNNLYVKFSDKPTELFVINEDLNEKVCFSHLKKFKLAEVDCYFHTQSQQDGQKIVIVDEDNSVFELSKLANEKDFLLYSKSPIPSKLTQNQCESDNVVLGRRVSIKADENGFKIYLNQSNLEKNLVSREQLALKFDSEFKNDLSLNRIVGTNRLVQRFIYYGVLYFNIISDPDSRLAHIFRVGRQICGEKQSLQATQQKIYFYIIDEFDRDYLLVFDARTLMLTQRLEQPKGCLIVESNNPKIKYELIWDKQSKLYRQQIRESQFEDAPKQLSQNNCFETNKIIFSESKSIALDQDGKLILFDFVVDQKQKVLLIKKANEQKICAKLFHSEYAINLKTTLDFQTCVLILNKNLIVYTASKKTIGFLDLSKANSHQNPHYLSLENLLQETDFDEGYTLSYAFQEDRFFIDVKNHQILWSIKNYDFSLAQKMIDGNLQSIGCQVSCLLDKDQFGDLQKQTFQFEKQGVFDFTPQSLRDIEVLKTQRLLATKFKKQGLFASYSLLNILETDHMLNEDPRKDSYINLDTIIARFPNTTTLKELQGKDGWLDFIHQEIQKRSLHFYLDQDQIRYNHIFLRMLYLTLQQKFDFVLKDFVKPIKTKKIKNRSTLSSNEETKTNSNILQVAFWKKTNRKIQTQQFDKNRISDQDLNSNLDKSNQEVSEISHSFDQYLQLLLLCNQSRTTDVVTDVQSFYALFKNTNVLTNQFLEVCFGQTIMSQSITNVNWNPSKRVIAFGSNTSLLSKVRLIELIQENQSIWDKIREKTVIYLKPFVNFQIVRRIYNKDDWGIVEIELKIYDITWLNDPKKGEQKTGKEFLQLMAKQGTQKMYTHPLLNALLYEQYYSHKLMPFFILYLTQILLQFVHFTYVLPSFTFNSEHFAILIPLLALLVFQMVQEILQLIDEGWNYLFSFLNISQLFTIVLNFVIIILGLSKQSDLALDQMEFILITGPSISSFLMIVQILYWFALFESTSFYVTMISQSFRDISFFLLFLLICIIAFANAIYVVNNNQKLRFDFRFQGEEDYQGFIDEKVQGGWSNTAISQYLLGLGEFEFDEYNKDEQDFINQFNQYSTNVADLLWLYFLMGTLLTQIILMNTLIAILGDTFSMIMEKRDIYALIQRTSLYADYLQFIRLNEVVHDQYLYVVRPLETDDENQQWEGAITSIKSRMRKNHDIICKEVKNQSEKSIQESKGQFESVNRRIEDQNKMIQRQIVQVKNEVKTTVGKIESEVKQRVDEIKIGIDQRMDEIKTGINYRMYLIEKKVDQRMDNIQTLLTQLIQKKD